MSRGVFAGGDDGSASNVIDYVDISSAGNATDFGDLTQSRYDLGNASSSTRGVLLVAFLAAFLSIPQTTSRLRPLETPRTLAILSQRLIKSLVAPTPRGACSAVAEMMS